MKKISALLILIAAIYGISEAAGVGTTGAQFLKIDPSARPLGMGGAFCAVADDCNAVFYNPAGLARLEKKEVSGTYVEYFQSIDYGSLAGVMPLGAGALGLGINYLGVPDIQRRGVDDIDDPDGTAGVDTFDAMDTAISVAYARKNAVPSVINNLDLGANLRFIYQTIDDESAFSAMVDLGAYYPVASRLSLAFNIQNIGMDVKFKDEGDPLPLNFKAGAAYRPLKGLTVACDINEYIVDEMLYACVGAEYWLFGIIGFRGGYKYGYDTDKLGSDDVGLSGGMGFRYFGLGLDYTFAPFGELGDTHRMTFMARF
ncbi:MAG: PorV/PorQ family protein [Elusimicrobia bacterium]|nr:PorV/PorQ family protein [Elusimicrobiota bacterium]